MYHSEFDVATFETARDALRAFAERFGMLLRIGGETHRYVEAMTVQQAPGPQTNLITVVGGSGAAYEAITLIQALDEPPRVSGSSCMRDQRRCLCGRDRAAWIHGPLERSTATPDVPAPVDAVESRWWGLGELDARRTG
jgi:hypothetical protein